MLLSHATYKSCKMQERVVKTERPSLQRRIEELANERVERFRNVETDGHCDLR